MLTFLTWGIVAVVWTVTMVLAAWFAINFNPNTGNMSVWKRWCINVLMIIVTLYTLPLLIVVLMFEGICYVLRRL